MRSINSPAELPADFETIDGEDHPDTVIANAATAIERERCAKIAETAAAMQTDEDADIFREFAANIAREIRKAQ